MKTMVSIVSCLFLCSSLSSTSATPRIDDRYEKRSIPDHRSRSRRNPPPPAVRGHRSQPPPPAVGVHRRTQPPPPAVGVHGDSQPPPPVVRRSSFPEPPHTHSRGVRIDEVSPRVASPGEVIRLLGVNFGTDPGTKILAINLGRVNWMAPLEWSDGRILCRIPPGLPSGRYRVLIYYDDSYRTSSNSLEIVVRRRD
jgi:hypothetical protein